MSEENMKKFYPELAEYYQKGDCCAWIVELRKQVSEKDKEIERLNNIINELEKYLENVKTNLRYIGVKWDNDCLIRAEVIQQVLHKLKELKESDNNE